MFLIAAFLLLLAAALLAAVQRGWALALLALGLCCWVLDASGPIRIG